MNGLTNRDRRGRPSAFHLPLLLILIHTLLAIATPSSHDNLAALANTRRHSHAFSRKGSARRAPSREKERVRRELAAFGGEGWTLVERSTVPKGRMGLAGSGMSSEGKRNVERAGTTFNTVAQVGQASSAAPVAASAAKKTKTKSTQAAAGALATTALTGNPLLAAGGTNNNGGGSPFFGDPFFGTGEPFFSSSTSVTAAETTISTTKETSTTKESSTSTAAATSKVSTTTTSSAAASSTGSTAIQGNASGGIGITVQATSQIAATAITVQASPTATSSAATSSSVATSAASSSAEASSSASASASSSASVSAAADQASSSVVSAAAQSAPAAAFVLPGKSLAILPIGLGVFAGVTVLALIVVGVVTFERRKYRAQFRQRRMAEQVSNAAGFTGGAGAHGGTDNGGRMTEGRI